MSILLTEKTRAIVQGMGKEGQFHAERMLKCGTKLVGCVSPGKGGTDIQGLRAFNTVEYAVARTGAK